METMRRLIKKHKRKILCTSPVIVLLLLTYTGFVTPTNDPSSEIELTASATEGFVGDAFSVQVNAETDTPINAIEANIVFQSDLLSVSEVSETDSLINLWVEKPTYAKATGTIAFSGGVLQTGGFVKKGKILTVLFTTMKEGKATVSVNKAFFALADGKGTLVTPKSNSIAYNIETKPVQNPDLNDNGKVDLGDAGLWVVNLFNDKKRDDLNGDGKINLRDMYFFF